MLRLVWLNTVALPEGLLVLLMLVILWMSVSGWYSPRQHWRIFRARCRARVLTHARWQVAKIEISEQVNLTLKNLEDAEETRTVMFNYQHIDARNLQLLVPGDMVVFDYHRLGKTGDSPYEPSCYLRASIRKFRLA